MDRDNVGAVFNLCHYLKTAGPSRLEQELGSAFPHVLLVSINGADDGETQSMGWDRLIQPLDQGSFDVAKVLRVLKAHHYDGPVGLQVMPFVKSQKISFRGQSRLTKTCFRKSRIDFSTRCVQNPLHSERRVPSLS